jgi:hypothetical protein
MRPDGSGLVKAFEQPVLNLVSVSPHRQWVFVWAPASGNGSPIFEVLPMDGGNPVVLGTAVRLVWSPDGATIAFYSPFGAIGQTLVPRPFATWPIVASDAGRRISLRRGDRPSAGSAEGG